MDRPPPGPRMAAVLIDLGLLLVVGPVLMVVGGVALASLVYLAVGGDCPDPCDGPGMVGFGLAALGYALTAVLYWPVLVYWRRRTIGARLVGLRYEGRGIRRHLAWAPPTAAGVGAPVPERCDRPPR